MAKKKTQEVSNSKNTSAIDALAVLYYDGNQTKNRGATEERNATKKLEAELANSLTPHVTKINDHMFLEMGYMETESEEIDPKLFFEKYPDKFWEMISVPKTVVQAELGEKEVALMSRPVKKNTFKIVKHKTDPNA